METWMMGGFLAPEASGPVAADVLALRMLVAFLCAWAMGFTYTRTHGALSYSQNFVQSLVLLAMIVTVIMGIVGDSLSRAFGLAAALAVVRFRTPVKDARDTTFLFMSVAAGMASGAGQLGFAAMATVVMVVAVHVLEATSYGSRVDAEGVLRFRYAGGEDQRSEVHAVLTRHARFFRLTGARSNGPEQPEELVYDIDLRSDDASVSLVRELGALQHVSAVTLLPTARIGEA
jgi:uncharacterized membrane protein YhiD involved in acid resistance